MADCDSDGSVDADYDIGDDENDNDDDNYLSNTSSAVLTSPMSPTSPLLESNSTDEEKSMAVSLQRVDLNLANRYDDSGGISGELPLDSYHLDNI